MSVHIPQEFVDRGLVPPEDTLPLTFKNLLSLMLSDSKLGTELSHARTKTEIYRTFERHVTALEKESVAVGSFLGAIIRGAGFDEPQNAFPRHPRHRVLGCEYAEEPLPRLRQSLVELYAREARLLMENLNAQLKDMVVGKRIGVIGWSRKDPKMCNFYFVRRTVRRWTTTSQEYGQTQLHHHSEETVAAHLHSLVDAKRKHPANISVRCPGWVQSLISKVPLSIYPYVQLVIGEQVHEWVLKQVSHSMWSEPVPQWNLQFDPCLTLGPYVLAGWCNDAWDRKNSPGIVGAILRLLG